LRQGEWPGTPLYSAVARQSLHYPKVQVALGTPALHAFGDVGPEALVEAVGVVGEFLGLVGSGELLHR
jgi:hypothetical protein